MQQVVEIHVLTIKDGDSNMENWIQPGKIRVIGCYGHTTIPPGDLDIKHVDFIMGLKHLPGFS